MSLPLIIDTDPGIDDALAIMLAAASPEIQILALTTVAGNVGIEHTSANAASLADLLELDCPVGVGASGPLMRTDRESIPEVHGTNGLAGLQLVKSGRRLQPAIPLMARLIAEAENPVTIAAIGPLTNVALLLDTHPEVTSKIGRIVVMGGGFLDSPGNKSAAAEFNFYFDPDAAAQVFQSDVKITMVGLNVTNHVVVGMRHLPRLQNAGGAVFSIVNHMMSHYGSSTTASSDGSAQHDSVALAAVIDPSLITTESLPVDIETRGTLTAGMSVVDLRPDTTTSRKVEVAVSVDFERFRDLLDERLGSLASRVLKPSRLRQL